MCRILYIFLFFEESQLSISYWKSQYTKFIPIIFVWSVRPLKALKMINQIIVDMKQWGKAKANKGSRQVATTNASGHHWFCCLIKNHINSSSDSRSLKVIYISDKVTGQLLTYQTEIRNWTTPAYNISHA